MAGCTQCSVKSLQFIQAMYSRYGVGTTRIDEHRKGNALHLH